MEKVEKPKTENVEIEDSVGESELEAGKKLLKSSLDFENAKKKFNARKKFYSSLLVAGIFLIIALSLGIYLSLGASNVKSVKVVIIPSYRKTTSWKPAVFPPTVNT